MRTLLLVDGNNLLYRAFFAVPDLATRSGVPTNAVFGFVRLLRQMEDAWSPDGVVVAFDGGIPDERKALLGQYKAQRKPMPDRLREQIPFVERYLHAARVAWARVEKEEADDVIASICRSWSGDFERGLIASSDKDLFQLVCEKILIVPVAGKGVAMGPAEVRQKTGVSPSSVRDWLALVGDAADNIPGVPGVGVKTAARLIEEYGTVEAIYLHLGSMPPGRLRDSLSASRDIVERNLAMMSLRETVDSGLSPGAALRRPADGKALLALFEELEFDSMAREYRQGDLFEA
jgi:DNA polymerase-1